MSDSKNRKKAIVLLLAARGLRGFADGFAILILPVYLVKLGYGATAIGVIAALSLFGTAICSLTIGLIAPRYELRRLMLASAFLIIVTGFLFPAFENFSFIAAIAFIGTINPSGGDLGLLVPLEHSLLTQEIADRDRTSIFARYSLVGVLSMASGSLAAALPTFMESHGLTALFALKVMFCAYGVIGIGIAFLYTRLPRDHAHAERPRSALGPSRKIVYKLAALFSFDSFAGGFIVQSLLALWLFQRFDLSLGAAGVFFFWSNLCSALSFPLAPKLARRFGLINTIVWTHIPSSFCLVAAALSPNLYAALGFLLARAAFAQMDVPTRSSYVMAVVTPPERAAAASVTVAPRSIAAALSPALAGLMLASPIPGLPLIVCAVLKIIYDIVLLMMFRNTKPPEELAPPEQGIR